MFLRGVSIFLLALLVSVHAVDFGTVEFPGKRVTVCRVDVRKGRLQLFHRDGNGQPFKRFPALAFIASRGGDLTAARGGNGPGIPAA